MSYPPEDPAEGFTLTGIPGVRFLDVADPRLPEDVRAKRLAQIKSVHSRYFEDYEHVFGEWDDGLANGWPDDETIVHLWLLLDGDRPVGEVIQHSNLRRGVLLVHFVCLDADVRAGLPRDWLQGLADGFTLCGQVDADRVGVPLWAVLGEVPPSHVPKWARVGFHGLDVGYLEPRHGMHWRDGGKPVFFPMMIVIRLTRAGTEEDLGQLITDGLSGYIFDYYDLPADDPEVARILATGSAMTVLEATPAG